MLHFLQDGVATDQFHDIANHRILQTLDVDGQEEADVVLGGVGVHQIDQGIAADDDRSNSVELSGRRSCGGGDGGAGGRAEEAHSREKELRHCLG